MGWWAWLTRNRPAQGTSHVDRIEEQERAIIHANVNEHPQLSARYTVSMPVISPDLSEHSVSFAIRDVHPEAFRTTSSNFEGKCRDIIRNVAGADAAQKVMIDLYRHLVLGNYTTFNGKGGKVTRAALDQVYPEQGALPGFELRNLGNTAVLMVYNLVKPKESGHMDYAILGGILVQMLNARLLNKPKLQSGADLPPWHTQAQLAGETPQNKSINQETIRNPREVSHGLSLIERDEPYATTPQDVKHPGFIYILVNPSYRQNMLKIGKTTRLPESRAEEITNATGVPTRFYIAYDKHVANCHAVERLVHRRLDRFRVAHNREFFELPLKEAIAVIEEIAEDVAEAD